LEKGTLIKELQKIWMYLNHVDVENGSTDNNNNNKGSNENINKNVKIDSSDGGLDGSLDDDDMGMEMGEVLEREGSVGLSKGRVKVTGGGGGGGGKKRKLGGNGGNGGIVSSEFGLGKACGGDVAVMKPVRFIFFFFFFFFSPLSFIDEMNECPGIHDPYLLPNL
jgi:hypothetical protein